ncbi:MAG: prolipoprotein diacylglyceryl transferase [Cyclobacteriaceae bacterium]
MSWVKKLQDRWNLKNTKQVVIVLIVFACTGFTIAFLKKPIVGFFVQEGEQNFWFWLVYLIVIFPVYCVFLLFYGFIFGQFKFFWGFVKKTFNRLRGKKNDAEQK